LCSCCHQPRFNVATYIQEQLVPFPLDPPGHVSEGELLKRGVFGVDLRVEIPSGPDELRQVHPWDLRKSGDELDGRTAAPQHGDPFPLEVDGGVPAQVVERHAPEGVDAREVGQLRAGKGTIGGDEDIGGQFFELFGLDVADLQGVFLRLLRPSGGDVVAVEPERAAKVWSSGQPRLRHSP